MRRMTAVQDDVLIKVGESDVGQKCHRTKTKGSVT